MNNLVNQNKVNNARIYVDRKQKVFTKFNFLNTKEMRKTINLIISEKRKIPLEEAKKKHCIRPVEYNEFILRMGIV